MKEFCITFNNLILEMLKLKIGKFLEQKYHKYTGTEENLM